MVWLHFYNDITDELMNYLHDSWKDYIKNFKKSPVYLLYEVYNGKPEIYFRVPGSTSGAIIINDDLKVIKIVFNRDYPATQYKLNVDELEKIMNNKFIGYQIKLPTVDYEDQNMLPDERKQLLDSMMKRVATGWCGNDAFELFIKRFPEEYSSLLPLTFRDYSYIEDRMDYCEYCEYWYFKNSGIYNIKLSNKRINVCGCCISDIKDGSFNINATEEDLKELQKVVV